jgi:hypothetical protein
MNIKPNRQQIVDAIAYFEGVGFIKDLTTDKRHYAQILLNHAKYTINASDAEEIFDAKNLLYKAGYQIAIFNVSDITDHFYCSEDMAHQILEEVYDDMDEDSWNEIVYKCNHYEIKQKD